MNRSLMPSAAVFLVVTVLSAASRSVAADPPAQLAPGMVTVVAGRGPAGSVGDGGPAILAALNLPHSITFDRAGNLHLGDVYNYRLRRIGRDGNIVTVAGGGRPADGLGDGGPAANARFDIISDVAVDGAGNLYLSEPFAHRVRKIAMDGTITTVAGTGKAGFAGDGGPGAAALLNGPGGLAVDAADNLYIIDGFNLRVRRLSPDGTITTVAGNGEQGYTGDDGPALQARLGVYHGGLAVDGAGNVYIPDMQNHAVRKVSTDGTIRTVAGTGAAGYSGDGGPAAAARLNHPHDVVVDSAGNLFITDWSNHRVRKMDTQGIITTVAGNGDRRFTSAQGPATSIGMASPLSVAVDANGDLFIAHSTFDYAGARPSKEHILKVFGVGAPGLVAGRLFPQPEQP